MILLHLLACPDPTETGKPDPPDSDAVVDTVPDSPPDDSAPDDSPPDDSPPDSEPPGDTTCVHADPDALPAFDPDFIPMGVGGGGAMAAFSVSPFDPDLWFVDTDMGTLFRSPDGGTTWFPVPHRYLVADSDYAHHVPVGFTPSGAVLYSASGVGITRSDDDGQTWAEVQDPTLDGVRIVRFYVSTAALYAATTSGVIESVDDGRTWATLDLAEAPLGFFVDPETGDRWAGTTSGVWRAHPDSPFSRVRTVALRAFAGGRSDGTLRLAALTDDASACPDRGSTTCGWVETSTDGATWANTGQVGGEHLAMAANDPDTIYVTGASDWAEATGTSVWVSLDGGATFALRLLQSDWSEAGYPPWPAELLDYSAVGLETGWDESGYWSFSAAPENSCIAGGSQNYFLLTTHDAGATWESAFTRFADTGDRERGKRWETRGLEVVSVYDLRFLDENPDVGLAPTMDQTLQRTDDAGATWRIIDLADYRACPDGSLAEDVANVYQTVSSDDGTRVWAVGGYWHDWPEMWYPSYVGDTGGVYVSEDQGETWSPLFCGDVAAQRQYLSVAFSRGPDGRARLFLGSMGSGVFVYDIDGEDIVAANDGIGSAETSIGQIEVDPTSGDVYALVSTEVLSDGTTNAAFNGLYRVLASDVSAPRWTSLRGTLQPPGDVEPTDLWQLPRTFAIDWTCSLPTCEDLDHRPVFLGESSIADPAYWGDWGLWSANLGDLDWTLAAWVSSVNQVRIDDGRVWSLSTFAPFWSGHPYAADDADAEAGIALDAGGAGSPGGIRYSDDGGRTWCKDTSVPLQMHPRAITPVPGAPDRVIYSWFGGGMASVPRPPTCVE